MTRRILITGGAGFVGQWLSRALLQEGWKVYAGALEGAPSAPVLDKKERDAICWTSLDVTSESSIRAALDASSPERVVHLAGIAFAPEANASPVRAFEINALGAMRLLGALNGAADVRTLVVGSAEEYGAQDASAYPIGETAALRPLTPYAVAKAAQEMIALQFVRSQQMQVVCTRSFNHSGVGHGEPYLLPSLVARVRRMRGGASAAMPLGNDVVRDFLHVDDAVTAYLLLVERGSSGEVYNVSSGVGVSTRQLAERVLLQAGVAAEISTEPSLVRPGDIPVLVGSPAKLQRDTGWTPTKTHDDIIADLLYASKN